MNMLIAFLHLILSGIGWYVWVLGFAIMVPFGTLIGGLSASLLTGMGHRMWSRLVIAGCVIGTLAGACIYTHLIPHP